MYISKSPQRRKAASSLRQAVGKGKPLFKAPRVNASSDYSKCALIVWWKCSSCCYIMVTNRGDVCFNYKCQRSDLFTTVILNPVCCQSKNSTPQSTIAGIRCCLDRTELFSYGCCFGHSLQGSVELKV